MSKYISSQDFKFAQKCKAAIRKEKPDVWVEPVVPKIYSVLPNSLLAWQYDYLKVGAFIDRAVQVAKNNNRKVRLYIQDTADVWNHDDIKQFVNTTLSRNYTPDPSGEVHGHSHMVGGMFFGGNSNDIVIGLVRAFAEAGLIEVALQKGLGDTGGGTFAGLLKAHQDVRNDKTDYAKFVNMSYGSTSSYAPLSQEMAEGVKENIFYFASIGNSGYVEGQDRSGFPGNDANTVGCASNNKDGQRSGFSSVDSSRVAMFMSAPGQSVTTTLKDGKYGIVSGTSFSGPACCAMGIIQYLLNPVITNQNQLKKHLLDDITDIMDKGQDIFTGHGAPIMSETFFSGNTPPPPPPPVLSPPTLIAPINNSTVIAEPVLVWNPVMTANAYYVQVAYDSNFTNMVADEIVTITSYDSFAKEFTDYYWRVKALNDDNRSGWSDTWKFTYEEENEEPPEEEWPTKVTPYIVNEEFSIKYKQSAAKAYTYMKFRIAVDYRHTDRAETSYNLLADKLRSYYSRVAIFFSKEPDQHVASFHTAKFTNMKFKGELEVTAITSTIGNSKIILQDKDLKKVPAQEDLVEIKELW